jgi:oligopeptide/dipeptide ABC transporter ATP-binding protein
MSGLVLEGISKRFNNVAAVDYVDLSVPNGTFVCMLGPSGCGKTTLLRTIAGLEEPTSGRILIDGKDITKLPAHQRDFGMVFQSLALFPHLNVGENVAYPLRIRGVSKADQVKRAEELLALVDLGGFAGRPVSKLSGGQRQRVAIARAFAGDPKLVILDEPTSALDVSVQASILNLLLDLQRESEVAYLFISHDLAVVRYLSDRIGVMYLGEIVEIGPAERVFRPPFHPYTQSLIAAVPRLGTEKPARPVSLDVAPPGPADRPSGCPFHTRCPRAYDPCRTEAPPWRDAGEGHMIRCWIALDALEASQTAALRTCRKPDPVRVGPRP